MAISYPNTPATGGPDVPTTTTISTTSVTICAANSARALDGLIVNNATKILWVSFLGAAATTASPSIPVPANGGALDIPGSYTGAITGIWAGTGTGSCTVHEFSYQ